MKRKVREFILNKGMYRVIEDKIFDINVFWEDILEYSSVCIYYYIDLNNQILFSCINR